MSCPHTSIIGGARAHCSKYMLYGVSTRMRTFLSWRSCQQAHAQRCCQGGAQDELFLPWLRVLSPNVRERRPYLLRKVVVVPPKVLLQMYPWGRLSLPADSATKVPMAFLRAWLG